MDNERRVTVFTPLLPASPRQVLPEALAPLIKEGRWRPPKVAASAPLWTDDYSNILGVLGKDQ